MSLQSLILLTSVRLPIQKHITANCFLFLMKLQRLKNKSLWDIVVMNNSERHSLFSLILIQFLSVSFQTSH